MTTTRIALGRTMVLCTPTALDTARRLVLLVLQLLDGLVLK
jgi:hypothetical protein